MDQKLGMCGDQKRELNRTKWNVEMILEIFAITTSSNMSSGLRTQNLEPR